MAGGFETSSGHFVTFDYIYKNRHKFKNIIEQRNLVEETDRLTSEHGGEGARLIHNDDGTISIDFFGYDKYLADNFDQYINKPQEKELKLLSDKINDKKDKSEYDEELGELEYDLRILAEKMGRKILYKKKGDDLGFIDIEKTLASGEGPVLSEEDQQVEDDAEVLAQTHDIGYLTKEHQLRS